MVQFQSCSRTQAGFQRNLASQAGCEIFLVLWQFTSPVRQQPGISGFQELQAWEASKVQSSRAASQADCPDSPTPALSVLQRISKLLVFVPNGNEIPCQNPPRNRITFLHAALGSMRCLFIFRLPMFSPSLSEYAMGSNFHRGKEGP